MEIEIVAWLIVGLLAGVLASLVVGGYGLVADIVIGIAGAFVGGYIFRSAHWHSPFRGLPGVVFVAFVGALVLLVALHVIHAITSGPPRRE
jgi:uncharacterized membrane protein YeaQ/YmgE (transglycosylase-associated protein family)